VLLLHVSPGPQSGPHFTSWPQPSMNWPHSAVLDAQTISYGWQLFVAPSQICPLPLHPPHEMLPPHPSEYVPQLAFRLAHVARFVQEPVVWPVPASSAPHAHESFPPQPSGTSPHAPPTTHVAS
jgi:hypothetical protein